MLTDTQVQDQVQDYSTQLFSQEQIVGNINRRDLRLIATQMDEEQARFYVKRYYILQNDRIRYNNQVRTMGAKPNLLLSSFSEISAKQESLLKKVLDDYSIDHPVGQWLRTIRGIGPVIAAGLISHIDPTRVFTAGSLWRYAGMDPSQPKMQKGVKRSWNADLKVLCCVPGTTITTRLGPKLIEDVGVGEEVLTHRGSWKPVTKVFVNQYDGQVNSAMPHGLGKKGPTLTDGHPVLTKVVRTYKWTDTDGRERFRMNSRNEPKKGSLDDSAWADMEMRISNGDKDAEIAQAIGCSVSLVNMFRHGKRERPVKVDPVEWTPAENVDIGHLVLSPTPTFSNRTCYVELEDFAYLHNPASRTTVEINDKIARMIGLFIGDGHTGLNNTYWSFGLHERHLSRFVIETLATEFGIHAYEILRPNMSLVRCGSKQLSTWLVKNVGKYAAGKIIPEDIFLADDKVIRGLLKGLFQSDGWTGERGASFTSISYKIATTTQQLLRMFGIQSSLTRTENRTLLNGVWIPYNRTCIAYTVSVNDVPGFYNKVMDLETFDINYTSVKEWDDVGSWHVVSGSVKEHYSGPVYNLEVQDDHSYVADGIAVHNCFKAGESFVKTKGHEEGFYGHLYVEKKEYYIQKNLNGEYSEIAARLLTEKKWDTKTVTYAALMAGRLSDGHIHAMARRFAAKIFLSHLFEVYCITVKGEKPPAPFAISILGHAHYIKIPNPDSVRKFVDPCGDDIVPENEDGEDPADDFNGLTNK